MLDKIEINDKLKRQLLKLGGVLVIVILISTLLTVYYGIDSNENIPSLQIDEHTDDEIELFITSGDSEADPSDLNIVINDEQYKSWDEKSEGDLSSGESITISNTTHINKVELVWKEHNTVYSIEL